MADTQPGSTSATGTDWKDGIIIKASNIALFLGYFYTNVTLLPRSYYGHGGPTYFSPSSWTFAMWTVIQVLLINSLVYQFYSNGKKVIVDGIGWRLPILLALNTAYLQVWSRRHYVAAFVLAVLATIVASHIYYIVKKRHPAEKIHDDFLITFPFSIWHAWLLFTVFVTGFEAFGVDANVHWYPGAGTKTAVFLSLFFLTATSAAHAFSSTKGDLAASVTISWSLFGVYNRQYDGFISKAALIFAIISTLAIDKGLYGLYKKYIAKGTNSDSEREPLLEA